MMVIDQQVSEALRHGQRMDITTVGRRSGQPRRIELVYHVVDGHVIISGRPGHPRSWLANLRADPRFTFHLKGAVTADLSATARVIEDQEERERLLRPIATLWGMDHARMVAASPLVEVTFD